MKLNRQRVNCLYRLSAIGAAVLMSMGAGQVWAGDGPVGFEAKLTARADEVCRYEVVQPSVSAASAIYTKGMNGSAGQVKIVDGESMKFVIKATGGKACSLNHVRLDTVYGSAFPIDGNGGAYGVPTKNSTGYYPVHWAVGGVSAASASGAELRGKLEWPDGERNDNKLSFPFAGSDSKTQGSKFSRFAEVKGGKRLPFAWAGAVIGNDGCPATLRNPFSHSRVNANQSVLISVEADKNSLGAAELELAVVPMVGLAPYNLTTHDPDDTTVSDGEELSAIATLTVTAS
jgi:hypothetical protein